MGFDQHRAGEPQQSLGTREDTTTSVRRLTSLFSRSSGLVDQSFFQCEIGNEVKANSSSALS
jgi:hypothetical protein